MSRFRIFYVNINRYCRRMLVNSHTTIEWSWICAPTRGWLWIFTPTVWLLWTLRWLLVFMNYRLFLEEFKVVSEKFILKFIKMLLSVSCSIKLSCVKSRHSASFSLNFNILTRLFGTYEYVWNLKYTFPFESAFRFSSKSFAPEHSIFFRVFVYLSYTSGHPDPRFQLSAVYSGPKKIGKLKK